MKEMNRKKYVVTINRPGFPPIGIRREKGKLIRTEEQAWRILREAAEAMVPPANRKDCQVVEDPLFAPEERGVRTHSPGSAFVRLGAVTRRYTKGGYGV